MSTKESSAKWLEAHYDPLANIHTLSQCMVFSDVSSDGDLKLVVADFGDHRTAGNVKVKVFKGTSLMTENTVLDLPTAVVSVYMDSHQPRTPVIAVAAGPFIYVFKNLRPYYRFTMPELEINKNEMEFWNQFKENRIPVVSLIESLDNLKAEGVTVTSRSSTLLNLPLTEQEKFALAHKDSPLKRQTVITCLETMQKSMSESGAISCLILGTESKQIYVLDPQAFTILCTMSLASVPVFMDISGLYDVEFTIIVACRNGCVYGLKRGSKEGRLLFEVRAQPVGIKRIGKAIVVACMDDTLQSFSIRGKQLWSQKMPATILAMEILDHKPKNVQAVLVALANNEVRLYVDKNHVDTLKTDDSVVAMKFGKFGREESTLVLITRGGALLVKMLKRTAMFENKSPNIGPPAAQLQKMDIPRKTKLFLDQTVRERESGSEMYRQFQHDLCRMRLETARNYVGVLQKSMSPISISQADPVKLHVEVTGIGPTFKLSMHVQNTSLSQPSIDLCLTFDYDNKLYFVSQPYINIPMLIPGLDYVFETFVECVSQKGISDVIKVFVLRKNVSNPLITAVVNMPVSDNMVIS